VGFQRTSAEFARGTPVISMGSLDFAMGTLRGSRVQQVSLDTFEFARGPRISNGFHWILRGPLRISMSSLGTCKGYPLELQWIS